MAKTNKPYGPALAALVEQDKARYIEAIQNRAERIDKGWTDMDDCFLSQKLEETGISGCNMRLQILAGDGLMEVDALLDEAGNEVPSRWVHTKYGTALVCRGVFANSYEKLAKKTGLKLATIKVPCWVKRVSGSGGGLCAAYSSYDAIVRWPVNMVTGDYVGYPED